MTAQKHMVVESPYDAWRAYVSRAQIEFGRAPSASMTAELIGIQRQYLASWLTPSRNVNTRPGPAHCAAIATFLNLKTGSRFTGADVLADFVHRGGELQKKRGTA